MNSVQADTRPRAFRPLLRATDLSTGGVLVLCALFLFVDLRPAPIQLWDESRIAVNALEMHLRGWSLTTTYGFVPDLWNTKPPLLVWLINAAMAVFGATEFAVRVPSMIAGMAHLALVMDFTRRVTGSIWTGALAALLLASSAGFFGEHGARTGDYDTLLCFFTTAYLQQLFFAAHRRRPGAGRMLVIGALVAGAILTKSVAGLVPGIGFGLYLLICNRWDRPLRSPWYAVAALVAVLPAIGFYLAREAAAPGYLASVWFNDVSGRFLTALDGHTGPPWYYLNVVFAVPLFSAGRFALLVPVALIGARGKARQGLLFALCAAAGLIAAVSAGSTKLHQYVAPAYPFLAIATAIAVRIALQRLNGSRIVTLTVRALLALALVIVAVEGAYFRYVLMTEHDFLDQAPYGQVFAVLRAQGTDAVTFVDPGTLVYGVSPNYSPRLRFYALIWAGRGLTVAHAASVAAAQGPVVASCDTDAVRELTQLGPDIAHVPGCWAIQRQRPRSA